MVILVTYVKKKKKKKKNLSGFSYCCFAEKESVF